VDLVLGDEWHHQPRPLPVGLERLDLLSDRVLLVLPTRHPAARRHRRSVPLAELADEAWTSGHPTMGWEEVTQRVCRQHGGFDPDIRHRTNDANISLSLVADGLAVAMVPELALPDRHPGIALREMENATVTRAIFAATRKTDAARPSIQALVSAVQNVGHQH
jgi:DNA-binding transcriptional LysR family regulator